jgi:hypothetical protein
VPRRAGQPRTSIAAIDALITRMMAPAIADRFASYDELIRGLEQASVEHTRPAGLWVRAMAAMIDVMLAFALALIVMLPLNYVLGRELHELGGSVFIALAAYQIVALVRRGRTVGLWVLELEVADLVTGGRPSWGRAALRVMLPNAMFFAKDIVEAAIEPFGDELQLVPLTLLRCLAAVPPVLLAWASLRSVAKLAVWDRFSRSMVRYRTRRTTAL